MWRYTVRRLLWLIVIMVCVAIVIFTIMYMVPGDPAELFLGSDSTEEARYAWREKNHLNDTYIVQLGNYLNDVFLHFDFGTSYVYGVPVIKEFASRLPRTMILGWTCVLISAGIGIPLGIISAVNRNSPLDHGLMILSMAGISVPNFWLALMMVVLFSLNLKLLPASGIGGIEYWIMPIIAGSVSGIAQNARQTRSAVLETIRADFVTTARAKGLAENKVIYKHMLPNALIPVVNLLGGSFANALSGTVVIETVFSFPGIGTYLVSGVTNRDYPVVRGCVLILAVCSAIAVLLVDLVYAYLDPRIKAQYVNSSAKHKKGA